MILEKVDREAMVGAVRDFGSTQIAPLMQRPELPADESAIAQVIGQLVDLGVLTQDGEPELGVWDDLNDQESCKLSTDLISVLAARSSAVAYQVSSQALAANFARVAGLSTTGAVSFDPAVNAAGRATARALLDRPTAADTKVLQDLWGSEETRPRLHLGLRDWTTIWWPRWTSEDRWQLCAIGREDCEIEWQPHGHGLDELAFETVRLRADSADAKGSLGAEHVIAGFTCHSLAVLTISIATARRAVDRARQYSIDRVQGGSAIGEHDAVAELLARGESAIATAQAMLARVHDTVEPIARLHLTWQVRTQAQPALARAGSDALQVFGGIGYMRDVGPEKDLRDLNTLRRIGGSPSELMLRCAAFDESRSRTK